VPVVVVVVASFFFLLFFSLGGGVGAIFCTFLASENKQIFYSITQIPKNFFLLVLAGWWGYGGPGTIP